MKKIIFILILVCSVFIIGCTKDTNPTISIENIDSFSKIKNFESVYISRLSFSEDWVVWIDIESQGNELRAEGRDKFLTNAMLIAIKKAEKLGEYLDISTID